MEVRWGLAAAARGRREPVADGLAPAVDALARGDAGGLVTPAVGEAEDGDGLGLRVGLGPGAAVGSDVGARLGGAGLPPVTTTSPRIPEWNRQMYE